MPITGCRADVTAVDQLRWSALHFACFHGRQDVAATLVNAAAADLDAGSVADATPLVEAVRAARPGVVQTLLRRGANVNCVTRTGTDLTTLGKLFTPPSCRCATPLVQCLFYSP